MNWPGFCWFWLCGFYDLLVEEGVLEVMMYRIESKQRCLWIIYQQKKEQKQRRNKLFWIGIRVKEKMDITEVTLIHHVGIVLLSLWFLSYFNWCHPVAYFVSLIYLFLVILSLLDFCVFIFCFFCSCASFSSKGLEK